MVSRAEKLKWGHGGDVAGRGGFLEKTGKFFNVERTLLRGGGGCAGGDRTWLEESEREGGEEGRREEQVTSGSEPRCLQCALIRNETLGAQAVLHIAWAPTLPFRPEAVMKGPDDLVWQHVLRTV